MATIDPRYSMPFDPNAPVPRVINERSNDLDRNAFLNLLITQLRHQDPLNPMDDRDFIAQLAQFSSLEQMQNLNATFNRSQAFGMMGQHVMATHRNPITGALVETAGRVDSVEIRGGEPWLVIHREGAEEPDRVRASDVIMAADDSLALTLTLLSNINNNLNSTGVISQSLALVGRTVQVVTTDATGNPNGFVEGNVDFIDFTGSFPMLAIGSERVPVGAVVNIADRNMIIGHNVNLFSGGNITTGGIIEGIRFANGNQYVVINGGTHRIDHFANLTDAIDLRRMGAGTPPYTVEYDDREAIVQSVFLRDNRVWMGLYMTDDSTVELMTFASFMGISTDDDD
ncbi:MAG: hypothetical protein FWB98_07610 [Defluviitaleaceae bacterium]|nr:hypothetical protein [Defluviitaleaceae bacterium]